MGGTTFMLAIKGDDSAAKAFARAVEDAMDEIGDDYQGYSGTVAEKGSFVHLRRGEMFTPEAAAEIADAMLDDEHSPVADKWGDAGMLRLTDGRWLIFGWAPN